MVVVQMPRGGCDCSGLRGRREGTETQRGPHPPRLTVTPVTSSRQTACSKDRHRHRQRRSAPSLSHWGATPPTQPLASSPTNTTREQRQKMRDARQARCRTASQLPKKKKDSLRCCSTHVFSHSLGCLVKQGCSITNKARNRRESLRIAVQQLVEEVRTGSHRLPDPGRPKHTPPRRKFSPNVTAEPSG
ncbi:putative retrotransposon hot spot (RHS) protein [Trypanosoma cruzi]|nr:putative retrotransposon hot spot (RHS) protein [Trypanosoma cruzi]